MDEQKIRTWLKDHWLLLSGLGVGLAVVIWYLWHQNSTSQQSVAAIPSGSSTPGSGFGNTNNSSGGALPDLSALSSSIQQAMQDASNALSTQLQQQQQALQTQFQQEQSALQALMQQESASNQSYLQKLQQQQQALQTQFQQEQSSLAAQNQQEQSALQALMSQEASSNQSYLQKLQQASSAATSQLQSALASAIASIQGQQSQAQSAITSLYAGAQQGVQPAPANQANVPYSPQTSISATAAWFAKRLGIPEEWAQQYLDSGHTISEPVSVVNAWLDSMGYRNPSSGALNLVSPAVQAAGSRYGAYVPGNQPASPSNPAGGGLWNGMNDQQIQSLFERTYGANWQQVWEQQRQAALAKYGQ